MEDRSTRADGRPLQGLLNFLNNFERFAVISLDFQQMPTFAPGGMSARARRISSTRAGSGVR